MAKKNRVVREKLLKSVRELAAGLGQSPSTVQGWIKHERWAWERRAPWGQGDVPEMLRWAASNLERGKLASGEGGTVKGTSKDLRDEKLRQEIRKLRAQADQAETALAKERGDLHAADACEEEAVKRAGLIRTAMQNIPTQVVTLAISQGMPHAAAPQYQRQVEELISGTLRHLAGKAAGEGSAGDVEEE